jgi:hypothetical protein
LRESESERERERERARERESESERESYASGSLEDVGEETKIFLSDKVPSPAPP